MPDAKPFLSRKHGMIHVPISLRIHRRCTVFTPKYLDNTMPKTYMDVTHWTNKNHLIGCTREPKTSGPMVTVIPLNIFYGHRHHMVPYVHLPVNLFHNKL